MPDQLAWGRLTPISNRPVLPSRTSIALAARAGALKTIPLATVVAPKDAVPLLCQTTAPVPAAKAWLVGFCDTVSRGSDGSQTVTLPLLFGRKSPRAVAP